MTAPSRKFFPTIGTAHPHKSRQGQTRAERLIARGYEKVIAEAWASARAAFNQALNADPDEINRAYAHIGVNACNAAIEALNDNLDPRSAYSAMTASLRHLLPKGADV
jgi:hypothetical protein